MTAPKVCVVVTARPSYARCKTVLEWLQAQGVPFEVVAASSALLHRYGRVADVIRADGFPVVEISGVVEGETLETGALSTGFVLGGFARHFAQRQPKLVVVIADRREVLAAAIAASYQHIPLMHLLGGEHSGNIDDKVRHAITALADHHAVAHEDASFTVLRMLTHQRNRGLSQIRATGCPSVDLARRAKVAPPVDWKELGGVGDPSVTSSGFFKVLLFHPTTNEYDAAYWQAKNLLLEYVNMPLVGLWPGEDPGAEQVAKAIREMREADPALPWRFIRNLPPERFYRLLYQCEELVGNSSTGVREAIDMGIKVRNVGNRQVGRYHGSYGDGFAGERIANWIQEIVS